MAGGLLEPIGSQNITLSDDAQKALKVAGYDIKTFDALVAAITGTLSIKSDIQKLSDRLDNLTAANIPSGASTYGLKSGSVEASTLGTRKTTITREGNQLTYDYNDIIRGVPADKAVVGATMVVTGGMGGGRYIDTGNTGIVTIPSLASSAKMDIQIQTKTGIIMLSNTVIIPEEDGSMEVTLGVQDFTTSITDVNTAEHLGILSAEVAALKQKISG